MLRKWFKGVINVCPLCLLFDLLIEQDILFEPYRYTHFLFDPTGSV